MVTRRDFIKKSGLAIAAAAMSGSPLKAMMGNNGQGSGASAAADGYVCQRPKPEERHFTSKGFRRHNSICPRIGRHDNDRIFEIDLSSL